MNLSVLLRRTEKLVGDNSPTILTAVGIMGSLAGAYLTATATIKAVELVDREQKTIDRKATAGEPEYKLTGHDVARLTWKLYVPPVVMLSLSSAAIIGANRVGTRRAAAMATAYGLSEKAYSEYKEKVIERLGEKKEREVRDEIDQDRVRRNPPPDTIKVANAGDQLVMEALTNRYFFCTVEELRRAENYINSQVTKHGYASLSMFYDILGLEHTSISDDVGWSSSLEMMELQLSSVMAVYQGQERAVAVFNYNYEPIRNYDVVH